jgi:hypothetical protein
MSQYKLCFSNIDTEDGNALREFKALLMTELNLEIPQIMSILNGEEEVIYASDDHDLLETLKNRLSLIGVASSISGGNLNQDTEVLTFDSDLGLLGDHKDDEIQVVQIPKTDQQIISEPLSFAFEDDILDDSSGDQIIEKPSTTEITFEFSSLDSEEDEKEPKVWELSLDDSQNELSDLKDLGINLKESVLSLDLEQDTEEISEILEHSKSDNTELNEVLEAQDQFNTDHSKTELNSEPLQDPLPDHQVLESGLSTEVSIASSSEESLSNPKSSFTPDNLVTNHDTTEQSSSDQDSPEPMDALDSFLSSIEQLSAKELNQTFQQSSDPELLEQLVAEPSLDDEDLESKINSDHKDERPSLSKIARNNQRKKLTSQESLYEEEEEEEVNIKQFLLPAGIGILILAIVNTIYFIFFSSASGPQVTFDLKEVSRQINEAEKRSQKPKPIIKQIYTGSLDTNSIKLALACTYNGTTMTCALTGGMKPQQDLTAEEIFKLGGEPPYAEKIESGEFVLKGKGDELTGKTPLRIYIKDNNNSSERDSIYVYPDSNT